MLNRMRLLGVTVAFLACAAMAAADMTYGFGAITSNNALSAAAGEAQLSVRVSEVTGYANRVLFTFANSGPVASSITDVYFQDGPLLDIASILNSEGTRFSEGASPVNLPSGNNVGFVATREFSMDSDTPVISNGVNTGEWAGVFFNLKDGSTYSDVVQAISLGLASGPVDGALRIGVHVQGFATGGGSESFINGYPQISVLPPPPPTTAVPSPEPSVLVCVGLGVLGLVKRRVA